VSEHAQRALDAVRERKTKEVLAAHLDWVNRALRLLARFEAFCSYHGLDVDTAFGCFTPPLPDSGPQDGTLCHVANGDTKNGG
jgi:hypothetical protein